MYNGLWIIEPNIWSIVGYSVIIPILSALGIIGNALILAVHFKAKMYLKSSVFTYLTGRCCGDTSGIVLIYLRSSSHCCTFRRERSLPIIGSSAGLMHLFIPLSMHYRI